jgi:transcriptional regulator with XRE-family HTH domain
MDFSKLEKLKKIKKMSYEELGQKIGMSKNGINDAILKKDMKVSVLEKISEVLGVKPTYFFEEVPILDIISESQGKYNNPINTKCNACDEKERLIKQLQDQLSDKERIIQILESNLGIKKKAI